MILYKNFSLPIFSALVLSLFVITGNVMAKEGAGEVKQLPDSDWTTPLDDNGHLKNTNCNLVKGASIVKLADVPNFGYLVEYRSKFYVNELDCGYGTQFWMSPDTFNALPDDGVITKKIEAEKKRYADAYSEALKQINKDK